MIIKAEWEKVYEENRKGKITVTDEFQRSGLAGLAALCMRFVPIHIMPGERQGQTVYMGYSPDFKPLKEGEMIPEYTPTFNMMEVVRVPHAGA